MKKKVVLFLTFILLLVNILPVNAANSNYNIFLGSTTLKESINVINGSESGVALGNDIYLNDCKTASLSSGKENISIDNPGQTKWIKITPTSDVYYTAIYSSAIDPSKSLFLYCYDSRSGKANIVNTNYNITFDDCYELSAILSAGKTYFLGACFTATNIKATGTISYDSIYTNLTPYTNINYNETITNLRGTTIFRFVPSVSSEYFMYYCPDYMNCNIFDSNGNLVDVSNFYAEDKGDCHSYCYLGYRLSANQTYTMILSGTSDFKITDAKAQKLSLNVSKITIKKGTKYTWLKSKFTPSCTTDKTLTYTSSNKKVATVDNKGVIKGKRAGKATITVKTSNGKKAKVKVTVSDNNIAVTKIKLNDNEQTVKVGDKISLTSKVSPVNATNKKVTWKSSNKKVAKVNSNGVVTMLRSGKATITCTAKDGSGKSASFKITDKKPDKIKLSSVKSDYRKGVSFSWKLPNRTFGYEFYRSTSRKGIYEKVNEITEKEISACINGKYINCSFSDQNSGTTYYYKIRAYVTIADKKVYGKYSSVKSVKIK